MFPGQAHPANNQRRHPVGQGYPNWFRENVVAAAQQMTIQEAAQLCGCSTSTVNRFNRLVEATGSVERSPRRGSQPPKLLADEVMVLLWAIINVPSLSLVELKTIVETASNRTGMSRNFAHLSGIGKSRDETKARGVFLHESGRRSIRPTILYAQGCLAFPTIESWTSTSPVFGLLMPRDLWPFIRWCCS